MCDKSNLGIPTLNKGQVFEDKGCADMCRECFAVQVLLAVPGKVHTESYSEVVCSKGHCNVTDDSVRCVNFSVLQLEQDPIQYDPPIIAR